MKKISNCSAAIFLFFSIPLIAQYAPGDSALVKTTFERKFDKSIIRDYLHSDSTPKVNAALLTIVQSDDSSFIPEIIKTNFSKSSEFICFTLGQLGENKTAADYLLSKLNAKNTPDSTKKFIIRAIGKTGGKDGFNALEKGYNESDGKEFQGISIALYDFYLRKIIDKEGAKNILGKELTRTYSSIQRKADAAFTIARLGLSDYFKEDIYKTLENNYSGYDKNYQNLVLVQYLVDNLRRAKYIPFGINFFNKLSSVHSPTIKIGVTSLLVFYPFKSGPELENYFRFFRDSNPNVTRQAAISIKGIDIVQSLRPELKDKIERLISDNTLTPNTRGELLLSYQKLFDVKLEDILEHFNNKIEPEYLYQAASVTPESEFAFDYVVNRFGLANGKERNDLLTSLINFKKYFSTDKFRKIIFSSLESDSPVLISLATSGIDSIFIANNKDSLEMSFKSIINNYKDDPNYYESIQAVTGVAELTDTLFFRGLLEELRNSKVYALKKYSEEKLGIATDAINHNEILFEKLWENSFEYKSALIETEKGDFTIEFTPGYAPMSAGNFCYLASIHFFEGIIFHRVVPAFVIQGGDPTGTGWGGPDYSIVSEFSPLHYSISAVGMASAGKDTEGSQWFVTTGDYPHLDGRYTIFGYVVNGMETVNNTDQTDKILSVKLLH